MEGREAQISSSGSKCGGWITFPFITSLSLKHTDTHIMHILFLISIYIKQGPWLAQHLEAGWMANLIIYLIRVFNVKSIDAAQISNITNGCSNLIPVIGAIVVDSFFGSFFVAAISASIFMLVIVLLCSLQDQCLFCVWFACQTLCFMSVLGYI